jgi:hypothetical protein
MSDLVTLVSLVRLARDTAVDPRKGASTVLSFAPPRQALWLMFLLVAVSSIILVEIVALIVGATSEGAGMANSPIALGLAQTGLMLAMVYTAYFVGKFFGGTGAFEESLLLMIWLQFILLCVQVVQIAAILLMPPLVGLITLASLALFFWLAVNFIAELHGFTSLGRIFLSMIACLIVLVFVAVFVLSGLGLTLMEPV